MTSSTSRIASLRSWFHECNFYLTLHLLKGYYSALHLRARSIPVTILAIVEAVSSLQLPAWQSVQWLSYGLENRESDFRKGQEIFLFSHTSLLTLQPTPSPIQLLPQVLSHGVKLPELKLTTYFHPVPELRINGATPPLPVHAFKGYNFTFICLAVYLRLYKVWWITINGSYQRKRTGHGLLQYNIPTFTGWTTEKNINRHWRQPIEETRFETGTFRVRRKMLTFLYTGWCISHLCECNGKSLVLPFTSTDM
jgi:hypothetical protein